MHEGPAGVRTPAAAVGGRAGGIGRSKTTRASATQRPGRCASVIASSAPCAAGRELRQVGHAAAVGAQRVRAAPASPRRRPRRSRAGRSRRRLRPGRARGARDFDADVGRAEGRRAPRGRDAQGVTMAKSLPNGAPRSTRGRSSPAPSTGPSRRCTRGRRPAARWARRDGSGATPSRRGRARRAARPADHPGARARRRAPARRARRPTAPAAPSAGARSNARDSSSRSARGRAPSSGLGRGCLRARAPGSKSGSEPVRLLRRRPLVRNAPRQTRRASPRPRPRRPRYAVGHSPIARLRWRSWTDAGPRQHERARRYRSPFSCGSRTSREDRPRHRRELRLVERSPAPTRAAGTSSSNSGASDASATAERHLRHRPHRHAPAPATACARPRRPAPTPGAARPGRPQPHLAGRGRAPARFIPRAASTCTRSVTEAAPSIDAICTLAVVAPSGTQTSTPAASARTSPWGACAWAMRSNVSGAVGAASLGPAKRRQRPPHAVAGVAQTCPGPVSTRRAPAPSRRARAGRQCRDAADRRLRDEPRARRPRASRPEKRPAASASPLTSSTTCPMRELRVATRVSVAPSSVHAVASLVVQRAADRALRRGRSRSSARRRRLAVVAPAAGASPRAVARWGPSACRGAAPAGTPRAPLRRARGRPRPPAPRAPSRPPRCPRSRAPRPDPAARPPPGTRPRAPRSPATRELDRVWRTRVVHRRGPCRRAPWSSRRARASRRRQERARAAGFGEGLGLEQARRRPRGARPAARAARRRAPATRPRRADRCADPAARAPRRAGARRAPRCRATMPTRSARPHRTRSSARAAGSTPSRPARAPLRRRAAPPPCPRRRARPARRRASAAAPRRRPWRERRA